MKLEPKNENDEDLMKRIDDTLNKVYDYEDKHDNTYNILNSLESIEHLKSNNQSSKDSEPTNLNMLNKDYKQSEEKDVLSLSKSREDELSSQILMFKGRLSSIEEK